MTLFFPPHSCESSITFFKRWEKTDNDQCTGFPPPCFHLYMFTLTLVLPRSSLGRHTTVAVLIQSVHQRELGIQMSKWPVAMCTITCWGQVGLTGSCTPGPHSSYAHPEPHAAPEIRRQNKIPGLGLGAVLELSCPAAYVSVTVSPRPLPDPAPGQCGGMVKPLVFGVRHPIKDNFSNFSEVARDETKSRS